MNNLTPEQAQAILDYSEAHGRYWKTELNNDWLTGKDASRPNGHLPQQVRNQHGPEWLRKVKL